MQLNKLTVADLERFNVDYLINGKVRVIDADSQYKLNQIVDVTPAFNFIQRFTARINYHSIGLIRGKKILVNQVDSEYPLGTQDGSSYRLKPVDECSCEPYLKCYIHANKFTEKH